MNINATNYFALHSLHFAFDIPRDTLENHQTETALTLSLTLRHFTKYTVHSTPSTLHSHSATYTSHFALSTPPPTLHCPLHSLNFTLCTLHSTLYRANSKLDTPHTLDKSGSFKRSVGN